MSNSAIDPPDLVTYTQKVLRRSSQLVTSGIWEGIEPGRLENWIEGFAGYSNTYLAALLLDSLIYRSEDQFKALVRHLFLEYRCQQKNLSQFTTLVDLLTSGRDPNVRIAPVIPEGPPTKSGPLVLRIAQKLFKFKSQWLIKPDDLHKIPASVTTVYFIDDFCGTGTQFTKFLEESVNLAALRKNRPDLHVAYLVTAIHQAGLDKIRQFDPKIEVFWADFLTIKHDFFSGGHLDLFGDKSFGLKIKAEYDALCSNVGLASEGSRVDTFNLNITYGFSHATPNNTLGIFWRETSLWKPLLDR